MTEQTTYDWQPNGQFRWLILARGPEMRGYPNILQYALRDRLSGKVRWVNVPVELAQVDEYFDAHKKLLTGNNSW